MLLLPSHALRASFDSRGIIDGYESKSKYFRKLGDWPHIACPSFSPFYDKNYGLKKTLISKTFDLRKYQMMLWKNREKKENFAEEYVMGLKGYKKIQNKARLWPIKSRG